LDDGRQERRLATGEDLADALDGRRREGGPVRGGSYGCAPHGSNRFGLGCTVGVGKNRYLLDLTIEDDPELRIVHETLQGPAPAVETGHVEDRWLLYTRKGASGDAALDAEIHNGKRGQNPVMAFRDSRLLTSQLPLRLVPQNKADEAVVRGAEAGTAALRGGFHPGPISPLMWEDVPERDKDLRRTGANISAAIARLQREDGQTFDRIVRLAQSVGDERIRDISLTRSDLGDVMLALREQPGRKGDLTPAREMSDGLLRFIAIAT